MEATARRRVPVAGVVLGRRVKAIVLALVLVVVFLYAYVSWLNAPIVAVTVRFPKLETQYAAANETSRMVYVKLRNGGFSDLVLTEVTVNGSVVKIGDPLPVLLRSASSYTYGFRYSGPWEGLIEVVFHADGTQFPRSLDLRAISRNSVEEAFQGSLSRLEVLSDVINLHSLLPFESPDAVALISEAKARVAEAEKAYSRGDYETGYFLVASALSLTGQATATQRRYEAMILTALGTSAAITAFATGLLLKRRRAQQG